MGYCVQNGKAIKCTFIYIRHTKEALERTQTPKRQEKSTYLKKKNYSHGRVKIIRLKRMEQTSKE